VLTHFKKSNEEVEILKEEGITCVTGLSLQTNKTLSGGLISASGISANCMDKRY
jgi:hypothetical protein